MGELEREASSAAGNEAGRHPARTVAVLMSVHHAVDAQVLRQSLESVLNQSWPHFDLFLVLDGPQNAALASYLQTVRDDRLHVVSSPVNRGLAASLNHLIDIAAARGYEFY